MAPSSEPQAKKRKLDNGKGSISTQTLDSRFTPTELREWTVSIALPTSLIADCMTKEQRTTRVGRIARALAIFSVDEIVIFDDTPMAERRPSEDNPDVYTAETDPGHFIQHILTYLETPPFMRKILFPLHPNLRAQGLLPQMDMPHHPHKDEWLPYREGVTLDTKPRGGKGTLVEIGIGEPVTIAEDIPPKTRLTLQMPEDTSAPPEPVHPAAPRTEGGYAWGFSVRRTPSLSTVFTSSPFEDGYDVSIGTSERGLAVNQVFPVASTSSPLDFQHLLIVFGGPRGLEYAAMNDEDLQNMGIQGAKTRELFDHWVNVLPNQGTRGIRTEEAVLIALTGLRRLWDTS